MQGLEGHCKNFDFYYEWDGKQWGILSKNDVIWHVLKGSLLFFG